MISKKFVLPLEMFLKQDAGRIRIVVNVVTFEVSHEMRGVFLVGNLSILIEINGREDCSKFERKQIRWLWIPFY